MQLLRCASAADNVESDCRHYCSRISYPTNECGATLDLTMSEFYYDFSIIVPTHNRPQQLAACLDSLAGLDFPRDRFEVVVVDDESAKPLDAVVSPFRERLHLVLVRQKQAGPAAARNRGSTEARGCYLAFTDDDCRADSAWLRRLHTCLANHSGDLI